MAKQKNNQKRYKSNFIRMREGRNINLAVRFVKSARKKGVDKRESMRLVTGLYGINPRKVLVELKKLNYI